MNAQNILLFVTAIMNFMFGVILAILNIYYYIKYYRCKDPWKLIRILAAISGLYFAFVYFISIFSLMNDYVPMMIDRPASMLALTVMICGTIWSAKKKKERIPK